LWTLAWSFLQQTKLSMGGYTSTKNFTSTSILAWNLLQGGTHNSSSQEFPDKLRQFLAIFRRKFGKKNRHDLPKNPGLLSYAPLDWCIFVKFWKNMYWNFRKSKEIIWIKSSLSFSFVSNCDTRRRVVCTQPMEFSAALFLYHWPT